MSDYFVGAKGAANRDKPADSSGGGSESFLTKPVTESLPSVKWWHAILGVVAAGGGVYLWKRK